MDRDLNYYSQRYFFYYFTNFKLLKIKSSTGFQLLWMTNLSFNYKNTRFLMFLLTYHETKLATLNSNFCNCFRAFYIKTRFCKIIQLLVGFFMFFLQLLCLFFPAKLSYLKLKFRTGFRVIGSKMKFCIIFSVFFSIILQISTC